MSEPRYFMDPNRHLVCVPYGVAELHAMAEVLDIKRCWYDPGSAKRLWWNCARECNQPHAHYDVPWRDIARLTTDPRVTVIRPRELLSIIHTGRFP